MSLSSAVFGDDEKQSGFQTMPTLLRLLSFSLML